MSSKIYIGKSKIKKAGRGVFAAAEIKKNTLIEICPVLLFDAKQYVHIGETLLKHYVYEHNKTGAMFALGYGSLYNHSATPNAKYEMGPATGMPESNEVLYITAIKPIAKDEEIYINYGNQFNEKFDG